MSKFVEALRAFNNITREDTLKVIKTAVNDKGGRLLLPDSPVGKWIPLKPNSGAKSLKKFTYIQCISGDYYQAQCVDGDYYPLQKLPLSDLCELADYVDTL